METKDRILRTALKLFVEKGFAEVSINDLIKEVGIAKGGFYHHFKSKDELIYEMMEGFAYPLLEGIIRSIDECNGSVKEKLSCLFKKYSEVQSYLKTTLEIDEVNDTSIMVLIIEGVKRYEIINNHIIDFIERLSNKIESLFEEGKKLGEISGKIDSKSSALYTLSTLEGAIILWGLNPNIDIKMLFENNFTYLWNSLEEKDIKN